MDSFDKYIDKIFEYGAMAVMAFALLFIMYKLALKVVDANKDMHKEFREERAKRTSPNRPSLTFLGVSSFSKRPSQPKFVKKCRNI